MDIKAGISEAGSQLQYEKTTTQHPHQICSQSVYENLLRKFRFDVLNENKQGQIEFLLALYSDNKTRRQRMGTRRLSRSQFFAATRRFLERQGLALDKDVVLACRCKLRNNLRATIGA